MSNLTVSGLLRELSAMYTARRRALKQTDPYIPAEVDPKIDKAYRAYQEITSLLREFTDWG